MAKDKESNNPRWRCDVCGYCTDDYGGFEDHLCDEDIPKTKE